MFRIGQSRDVHRLENGRKLVLGTVEIPCEFGCVAHSDGDALVHAIVEAIIGALGMGDIGKMFPDTDPRYKGISSSYFLKEIKQVLEDSKYEIVNIDSTIHIEMPMMKPYIESMRIAIAELLGLRREDVNVKATRGEKIGFIGRGEGVEAEAIVLLKQKSIIKKL